MLFSFSFLSKSDLVCVVLNFASLLFDFFSSLVIIFNFFLLSVRNSKHPFVWKWGEVFDLWCNLEITLSKATCSSKLSNQATVWLLLQDSDAGTDILRRQSIDNHARFQQSPPEMNHLFWTQSDIMNFYETKTFLQIFAIWDEAVQLSWWFPGLNFWIITTSFGLVITLSSVHSRAWLLPD